MTKKISAKLWLSQYELHYFVQLSSKINTLTLTLRGGRPFKISLTEPFLMCSTAASIEDKKNLHKNETCSIKDRSVDHYNHHHLDQLMLVVFAIFDNLTTTTKHLFTVFWFEISSFAMLSLTSLFGCTSRAFEFNLRKCSTKQFWL